MGSGSFAPGISVFYPALIDERSEEPKGVRAAELIAYHMPEGEASVYCPKT